MGLLNTERAQWLAANILPLEPLIRRWLSRVTPSGLDPDDVIQDAYAKLAALASVAHITQPKAYLFQVVKSLILAHVRHAQVIDIAAMAEIESTHVSMEEGSPERVVSGRQELERLYRAIERLPDACRRVFVLRKIEGLSQKEIASRLGISESTVEKHVVKAVRVLLAQLTAADGAGALEAKRGSPKMGGEHCEP